MKETKKLYKINYIKIIKLIKIMISENVHKYNEKKINEKD